VVNAVYQYMEKDDTTRRRCNTRFLPSDTQRCIIFVAQHESGVKAFVPCMANFDVLRCQARQVKYTSPKCQSGCQGSMSRVKHTEAQQHLYSTIRSVINKSLVSIEIMDNPNSCDGSVGDQGRPSRAQVSPRLPPLQMPCQHITQSCSQSFPPISPCSD